MSCVRNLRLEDDAQDADDGLTNIVMKDDRVNSPCIAIPLDSLFFLMEHYKTFQRDHSTKRVVFSSQLFKLDERVAC